MLGNLSKSDFHLTYLSNKVLMRDTKCWFNSEVRLLTKKNKDGSIVIGICH
jgi:hypothetical protein